MQNIEINIQYPRKAKFRDIVLSLFFIFYLIMPEYFALEISTTFPLITVSRCILILLLLCTIFKNNIRLNIPSCMIVFLILICIVDLYHLSDNPTQSIKSLFSLLVEQFLLFIALYNLIRTKEMVIKSLKLLVLTSGVMSALGCFETISGINLFYYLNTITRDTLQASYMRMGVMRAETSFGHPVFYSVYLVCLFPFAVYFFQKTREKKYLVIIILNLIALVCTETRGAYLAFVIVLLSMGFYFRGALKRIRAKSIITFILIVAIAIVITFILVPQLFTYLRNLVSSTLASFGLNISVSANFGSNVEGVNSRLEQLTGLRWQWMHNAMLFGFGPSSHQYGKIAYFINGAWRVRGTIDIGYLGYILQYGILGGIGYAVFYITLWVKAVRRAKLVRTDNLYKTFVCFFVAYFALLLTSMGNFTLFWLFASLFLIYIKLDTSEESLIRSKCV